MKPTEVSTAFKTQSPVLGKGQRGYVVNLTADGRPVFANTLDTDGVGRCLNFQDIALVSLEP